MIPEKSTVPERILAALVLIWAIPALRETGWDDWLHYAFLAVAVLGVVASISIWRASSRALRAYTIWAFSAVLVFGFHDARVEPGLSKLALDVGLVALLFGALGFGLDATIRRRRGG